MRLTRPAATFVVLASLALASPAAAQVRRVPAPTQQPQTEAAAFQSNQTADETRRELEELLKQYPPALPRILRLDPSLLGNPTYLQPYPALTSFLAQHPEIAHNPGYFFAEYDGNYGDARYRETTQDRAINMWRNSIEALQVGALLLGIGGGLLWLIRTLIEHRRWSRLSRIQTEVHNKLLDRFTSNQELLAYIETPAGRKFLESTPIMVDSPRAISAPLGRILWSAQAGAVLTVLGLGVMLVSRRALEEIASPMAAFGAIIMALGIGFIVSAVMAYMLTRRFGLLNDAGAATETRG